MQYKVIAPLAISVSKNKKFSINFNTYRNAHYQTLNKAKINYANYMKDQIATLPFFNKIKVEHIVFFGSNRLFDLDNIVSVSSKFFNDALVKHGKLIDDNYQYVTGVSVSFGGVDKNNPRVEIVITEV